MSAQAVLAATLVEPGRYEIREYPLPEPAPGCVLVKMEVSGICGTDKHTYQGYVEQYGGAGTSRPIPFPIIQGHENVGTIAAIGGDKHIRTLKAFRCGSVTASSSGPTLAAATAITAGTIFLITVARKQSTTAITSARKILRICLADGRSISM